MVASSYWRESIECALDEIGIVLPPHQVDELVSAIETSAENEGMATGRDCIPNPLTAEVERLKRLRLEDSKSRQEEFDKALREAASRESRLRSRIYDLERAIEESA